MDTANYDRITIQDDMVGESMKFVKPNTAAMALIYKENVIAVDLPKTVDLQMTETALEIKGATATNQLKEATLKTGLKTRVPPFIKIGEVVRVSTEEGSYFSRA